MAQQGPDANGENDDAIEAVSEVRGLDFRLSSRLPRSPAAVPDSNACGVIKPSTSAGKLVAAKGWGVTGEAKLKTYQVVSFAAMFEPSTSGTCEVEQGNVAVFFGSKLLAIAYAGRTYRQSIGRIAPLENGGVRLFSGDIVSVPVGDLQMLDGYLFRLSPAASKDRLGGRSQHLQGGD